MECDNFIIGAGLVGSSVAMGLGALGQGSRTIVVDLDLEGTFSSSELNAGGVRQLWGRSINVACARASIDYFSKLGEAVGYRPCGYLWLHKEETFSAAKAWVEKHRNPAWPTDVLSVPQIQERVPFLDKLDGVVGAVHGRRDGLINSNLLKNHFRAEAKRTGVKFLDRVWVESASVSASGTTLVAKRGPIGMSEDARVAVLGGEELAGEVLEFKAKRVVNCAGAWAPVVAQILGYRCPSKPVRRQICVFESRDVDLTKYGMTVDTSGVYFHPEANNGMAGYAEPAEPEGVNFVYDGAAFFEEKIWPVLYERSSQFERLKHLTGWAGLYETSPDETGIVGQVARSMFTTGSLASAQQIYEAHSFSGHGAMHSYAVGVALAELMVHGRSRLVDISPLTGERFERGGDALMHERLVI